MQEAILPATVEIMCGHRIISWGVLSQLNGFFQSAALRSLVMLGRDSPPAGFGTVTNITDYKEKYHVRNENREDFLNFLALLHANQSISATKAEDRVYGLLGLADHELREQISIHYGDTPVEAYQTFAEAVLLSSPVPSFLNLASSKRPIPGLPSWCPNFSTPSMAFTLGLPQLTDYAPPGATYAAGFNAQTLGKCCTYRPNSTQSVGDQPALLGFKGIPVDLVARVITPAAFHDRERETTPNAMDAAVALAWEANCLQLSRSTYRVNDQTVPDAHIRTLIAARRTFQVREQYEKMKYYLGQLCQQDDSLESRKPNHADAIDIYYEAMDLVCRGRTFFSTTQGRVGLGPPETLSGDQICVLHNASTPFILRKAWESPHYNNIIGESYVEGIMYGEAFKQPSHNDELPQSDTSATREASEDQLESGTQDMVHAHSTERMLWCI